MVYLHRLRAVRRFVGLESEYRVRELAGSMTPYLHRSRWDTVVHATGWRSGSQYVRLVMSDPYIRVWSGLAPRLVRSVADVTGSRGRLLTPTYLTAEEVLDSAAPNSWGFFVVRDPRAVVVSMYFSRLKSHPLTSSIAESRSALERMNKSEGMRSIIDEYKKVARLTGSWIEAEEAGRAAIFRFEDLTGDAQAESWQRLFDCADIAIPVGASQQLLRRYSFESLSGRKRGDEKVDAKYRAGDSASWRKHLDGPELDYFNSRWGDQCAQLGYVG